MRSLLSAVAFTSAILSVLPISNAQAQGGPSNAEIASIAERLCLAGSRYKISGDASALVMSRLLPGGQVQGSFEELHIRGNVDFQNEEIRSFLDTNTRECLLKAYSMVRETAKSPSADAPNPNIKSEIVKARVVGDLAVTLENAGTGRNQAHFGFIAINRSDHPLRLLMQQGSQIGPFMVDEKGRAKSTQTVVGLPRCKWAVNECFNQVSMEKWAVANKGIHLPFSLNFSHVEVPNGSLVNVSFTLLRAHGGTSGRPSFSTIPISFVRIPVRR